MPGANRRVAVIVILSVTLTAAIGVAIFAQRAYAQYSAVRAIQLLQESVVSDVQKSGGKVTFGPHVQIGMFEFRNVDEVTLIGAHATSEFYSRLCQLSEIKRLNLDDATIDDSVGEKLCALSKLERLSLAQTDIGDKTMAGIRGLTGLKSLQVSGTAITDRSVSAFAGMSNLTSLDVSDTLLSPAGITALCQIPSIRTITLDEKCITYESRKALSAALNLEHIEIRIVSGLGKSTRDLFAGKARAQVNGVSPSGKRMWNVNQPWEETIAGVVDIVAVEVELSNDERAHLFDALSDSDFSRPVGQSRPDQDISGEQINSVESLVSALRSTNYTTQQMCEYIRKQFTYEEVPRMHAAVRAAMDDPAQKRVVEVGLAVIVHYGIDQEGVRQLFSEMFNSEKHRAVAIAALNPWQLHRFGKRWPIHEPLADFVFPHLVSCAEAVGDLQADDLWNALGYLAQDNPKYARQVTPYFVRWLREGKIDNSYHIQRIVERNHEAGLDILPELRRMLADNKSPTFAFIPKHVSQRVHDDRYRSELGQAIAYIVPFSSESNSIAFEQLARLRENKGKPVTHRHGVSFTLLSHSDDPQTVKTIVYGLLELSATDDPLLAIQAVRNLSDVATAIRDRRVPRKVSAD